MTDIQMINSFEKWQQFQLDDDMDIQTEVAWNNWQAAWRAAEAVYINCLLCRNYNQRQNKCLSVASCIEADMFVLCEKAVLWKTENPEDAAC
jgi:hypothetical protein